MREDRDVTIDGGSTLEPVPPYVHAMLINESASYHMAMSYERACIMSSAMCQCQIDIGGNVRSIDRQELGTSNGFRDPKNGGFKGLLVRRPPVQRWNSRHQLRIPGMSTPSSASEHTSELCAGGQMKQTQDTHARSASTHAHEACEGGQLTYSCTHKTCRWV